MQHKNSVAKWRPTIFDEKEMEIMQTDKCFARFLVTIVSRANEKLVFGRRNRSMFFDKANPNPAGGGVHRNVLNEGVNVLISQRRRQRRVW